MTNLPGVAEGDHVVDIDVAGGGPCGAVVRALPGSRCSSAGGVLDDIGAVTCEDDFAGVAGTCGCQPEFRYVLSFIPD